MHHVALLFPYSARKPKAGEIEVSRRWRMVCWWLRKSDVYHDPSRRVLSRECGCTEIIAAAAGTEPTVHEQFGRRIELNPLIQKIDSRPRKPTTLDQEHHRSLWLPLLCFAVKGPLLLWR